MPAVPADVQGNFAEAPHPIIIVAKGLAQGIYNLSLPLNASGGVGFALSPQQAWIGTERAHAQIIGVVVLGSLFLFSVAAPNEVFVVEGLSSLAVSEIKVGKGLFKTMLGRRDNVHPIVRVVRPVPFGPLFSRISAIAIAAAAAAGSFAGFVALVTLVVLVSAA